MKKERSRKYGNRYVVKQRGNVGYNLATLVSLVLILSLLIALFVKTNTTTVSEPTVSEFKTTTKVTITVKNPVLDPERLLAGSSLELHRILISSIKEAEEVKVEVEKTEVIPVEKAAEEKETVEEVEEPSYIFYYTENDVIMVAKLLTKEAGGVRSITQKAAVAWVVLNRVMSNKYPNTIAEVITQPYQFEGWHPETEPYDDCIKLARDVLERWNREMNGETNVGRIIPEEYLYFTGDGVNNYFTTVQYGTPYSFGSQFVSPYKS